MNTLHEEIKLNEFYRHLSYEDVLNLCLSSSEFSKICKQNSLWIYLLEKDFGIQYVEKDVKDVYLLYLHALLYFSKLFPIITFKALQEIVEFIPFSEWDKFTKMFEMWRDYGNQDLILSTGEITSILNEEYEELDYASNMTNIYGQLFRQTHDDPALLNSEFNNIVKILNNDQRKFLKFVSKPSLVFVKKKPIIVKYDYELAVDLSMFVTFKSFSQRDYYMNPVENSLLSLL